MCNCSHPDSEGRARGSRRGEGRRDGGEEGEVGRERGRVGREAKVRQAERFCGRGVRTSGEGGGGGGGGREEGEEVSIEIRIVSG